MMCGITHSSRKSASTWRQTLPKSQNAQSFGVIWKSPCFIPRTMAQTRLRKLSSPRARRSSGSVAKKPVKSSLPSAKSLFVNSSLRISQYRAVNRVTGAPVSCSRWLAAASHLEQETGAPVTRFTARYWLIRKLELTNKDFAEGKEDFTGFFATDPEERRALGEDNFLNRVCAMVRGMKQGDFQITPNDCAFCDFGSVCRHVEADFREE